MSVDGRVAARAAAALGVLSELTPAPARPDAGLTVPLDWFRWLDSGVMLLTSPPGFASTSFLERMATGGPRDEETPYTLRLDRAFGERLAAVQQVRSGRTAVQLGWLWAAGTTAVTAANGKVSRRRVFVPLVTRSVRVTSELGMFSSLVPTGDPEISRLVADRSTARDLEGRIEYGGGAFNSFSELTPRLFARLPRLNAFARECADACGFAGAPLVLARDQPDDLMRMDGIRIVIGLAVFVADEPGRATRAGGLLSWPDQQLTKPTAFHAVYAGLDTTSAADDEPVEATLPLTTRQRDAVRAARHQLVTVMAGAPGTGKSHTLVSLVCDALRREESVLLAARSEAAVDALVDLMARQPGVTPVVFGSSERRAKLAQRLADGELQPVDEATLEAAAAALSTAIARRDVAAQQAAESLRAEWRLSSAGEDALGAARRIVPAASAADATELSALASRCSDGATGWRARRRRRAAARELRTRVGAGPTVPLDELIDAVRTVIGGAASSASSTDEADLLCEREADVRGALSGWLASSMRSPERLDRAALAAVSTLATALRSGRSARRVQLERLRDRSLVRALPVWIGTLGDVDDLLPPVPGLFDLVLVDEASSTDQTLAAPALLRGRRAVVVGDPRQLRHVSFLGDQAISDALDHHRVRPEDRSQLDVRRNSLFDAAAAVVPAITLDEHFRSAPHLIDVVAERIYDGRLRVATRTPVSETIDCIDLRITNGQRRDGTVRAEIDVILDLLRRNAATWRSVGVMTPFRAQANAIEKAVLASFDAAALVAMNLRTATVHGFQGNERDVMICSLGLVDDDDAGWTFIDDPHLLAVMLTRARTAMVLVASCHPDPASVLGSYVAAADSPPGPPPPAAELSGWAASIAADLRLAGITVETAYPTGRHILDIATIRRGRPVAIVCDLHPDGIAAHLDRHLALRTQGWTVINALRSEWDEDAAAAVVDLAGRLTAP